MVISGRLIVHAPVALGGEQAEEATALQAQLAQKEREVAELRQRLAGLMLARGSGGKIPEGAPKS